MTDLNVNFDDMDKTISLGGENIKDTVMKTAKLYR